MENCKIGNTDVTMIGRVDALKLKEVLTAVRKKYGDISKLYVWNKNGKYLYKAEAEGRFHVGIFDEV